MSELIDKLNDYIETTPKEQIKADWDKTKECDNVGVVSCTLTPIGHYLHRRTKKEFPLFKRVNFLNRFYLWIFGINVVYDKK